MSFRLPALLLLGLFLYHPAAAQTPAPASAPDTLRTYVMDAVVVTADRTAHALARSAAAVAVLDADALASLPHTTLTDALATLPGLFFINRDGLGYDPLATVRGFYGGGEVSYLQVLIDGKPVNNVETGLVNWNALPVANIETIEVLRGGSSSLYGDAAIGGVINIITKDDAVNHLAVSGGSFGTFTGRAHVQQGRVSAYADGHLTDGYRTHGERAALSLGGTLDLLARADATLGLSADYHRTDADDPGYLSGPALEADRAQSSLFFRFDNHTERRFRLALDGAWTPDDATRLSGYLRAEHRTSDLIRTFLLAPTFADTKNRDLRTLGLHGSAQVVYDGLGLPFANELLFGVDASLGQLDSRYYGVVTGPGEAYAALPSFARGDLDAQGTGHRVSLAAFARYELRPADAVTFTLGARLDRLADTFTPEAPSTPGETTTTHTAFSPRAGLNVRYAATAQHTGNVYATASRSFKAPTLDQLFDQRSTPLPFPPFSITLSSATLKPQRGTNIEAGVYHQAVLAPDHLTAELSLSVYQTDMVDEVDFDFEQFAFVNIGESRHRGIEAGLKLYGPARVEAFVNYTLQSVTLRAGTFEGNFVKAIPRDVIVGGVRYRPRTGFGVGLVVTSVRRTFLDDANTIPLPNHTTVNAQASYRFGNVTVTAEGFNLTDETYSTTGFPDPSGSDVAFFYPAAARSVRLGVAVTF